MAAKIFGYRELFKALVEYHITFVERLEREGYEKTFSLLLIHLPNREEKLLKEMVAPLLRRSDRLFYIDGDLIALLPGSDWNGAMKVHQTIVEALGLKGVEDRIVEYPTDGDDAFSLISNLYAR
jgi:hypothetical protein